MTDRDELKRARMSLAQAVTRSRDSATLADRRAVDQHRDAAEMRLRRAERDDLGRRVDHDLDANSHEARRNLRELMQLIDAELDPAVAVAEWVGQAAADGGSR